jgi:hypothetical protein
LVVTVGERVRLPQEAVREVVEDAVAGPIEERRGRESHPVGRGFTALEGQGKVAPHQDSGTLFGRVSQQVRGADEDWVGHDNVRRLRRDRVDQSVVLAAPRFHEEGLDVERDRGRTAQLGPLRKGRVEIEPVVELGLGSECHVGCPGVRDDLGEARPGDEADVVAAGDQVPRDRQVGTDVAVDRCGGEDDRSHAYPLVCAGQ